MNNEMYWVSAITYVIVLGIILLNDMKIKKTPNREEKSFRIMTTWVILFCVQDTVWGLCSDNVIKNDCIFFISSMVFHTSTVLTTFFCLYYVLVYLEKSEKQKRLFQQTKRHDAIKTQYCKKHGIKLLRLKYTLYRNGSTPSYLFKEKINKQLALG